MIAIPIIGTIAIVLCYILLVVIAYIRDRKTANPDLYKKRGDV